MPSTTPTIQEILAKAVLQMAERPDLTEAEIDWLYRLALRLIAEFSVSKPDKDVAA